MNLYNQTNIKNNIIYFPLWRVKYLKHRPWTWEERYDFISIPNHESSWPHNCRVVGAVLLANHIDNCSYCGANKLNEPTEEAVLNYMDSNYE